MGTLRQMERPAPPGWFERFAPGLSARRLEASVRLEEAKFRRRQVEFARAAWGHIEREWEQAFRAPSHHGATKDHGYGSWLPGEGSADTDNLEDLPLLRARARDLTRNDPHAAGLISTWCDNIIGSGLRPVPHLNAEKLQITDAEADRYRDDVDREFRRFWRTADAAGILSFGELQALALRGIFESGDTAVIPRPDAAARPSLRLQVIEADRIMTPLNKVSDLYIRDGVVIDELGRHLGIWVKNTHPGDDLSKLRPDDFKYIETVTDGVRNIYHLYRMQRPDQSRGIPLLGSALTLFQDLKGYFAAEVMAARIAACYALLITTPDPFAAAMSATTTGQSVAGSAAATATARAGGTGAPIQRLIPGMIQYLAPGQDVESFSPTRPNANFDPFVMRILRAIGAAINAPYEVVAGDYSQTTYTSGRMALTEARRVYIGWKNWFVEKFCAPIRIRLLEEAWLRGDLRVPKGLDLYENLEDLTAAEWVGPGWTWVDPSKEVDATATALDRNLTTHAAECAARGLNGDDVLEQRAREKRRMKELGLEEPAPKPAGPGRPPAKKEEDDNADAEE